jgi:hypothetical protein
MATKKHPIYRLHKIKIHPNRWLGWSIAYGLIVAVALVGYIKVSDVNFEAQLAENEFHPWHSYNDARLGFGIRYPADWSIEADNNSTISFLPTNLSDEGVSVHVTKPSAEKAIRRTLKILEESKIALDGQIAAKIINNLGQGHTETVILAVHKSKLYVLRGTDSFVEKLILTFHFK